MQGPVAAAAFVAQFGAMALTQHHCQPFQPPLLLPSSTKQTPSPEPGAEAGTSASPLPSAGCVAPTGTENLGVVGRQMAAVSSSVAAPPAKPARPAPAPTAPQVDGQAISDAVSDACHIYNLSMLLQTPTGNANNKAPLSFPCCRSQSSSNSSRPSPVRQNSQKCGTTISKTTLEAPLPHVMIASTTLVEVALRPWAQT
jgi:hypothetical protein